jgi:hypothetical protein
MSFFRTPCISLTGRHKQVNSSPIAQMIEYLGEENRVLREQLGDRRLRLNDDQRRRLAAKAKGLGLKRLPAVAGIVTTVHRWRDRRVSGQDGDRESGLGL